MSNSTMISATNTHLQDEVLYELRIPVSRFAYEIPTEKSPGVPVLGEANMFIAFDADGHEVAGATESTGLDYSNVKFPNDIIPTNDGLTHVFRGSYWIDAVEDDEDGQKIAILHLGGKVRCTVYDWCSGHRMYEDGIDQDDADLHFGDTETVFQFDGDNAGRVRMNREVDDRDGGLDGFAITINYESSLDRASLIALANQLEDVADELRGRSGVVNKWLAS